MPKFHYKAKKGPHETVEGEITADNPDQVVVKLDQMGLSPVSIVENGADTFRIDDRIGDAIRWCRQEPGRASCQHRPEVAGEQLRTGREHE